jgi:hypothetical protein
MHQENVAIKGFVCTVPVYKYKGWFFEYKPHTGAWPLRKDGEPRKRAGDVFWCVLSEFLDIPESERKYYRVSGGCIPF